MIFKFIKNKLKNYEIYQNKENQKIQYYKKKQKNTNKKWDSTIKNYMMIKKKLKCRSVLQRQNTINKKI